MAGSHASCARIYRRGRSEPLFRHGGQLLIRRGSDGCARVHRHEAWKVRRRGGEITYDAFAQTDRIAGHELYITNADESRTLVRLFLHAKRLYILEATVPRGAPPPLLFPQSLQILDEKGDRIRYQVDADGQRIERRPRNRADR